MPPFIGGEHGINNHEKEHCSNRTRQILETIKNQNDITRIYIFSRGPVYITGHEFNDPEPKPKLIIEAQRFKSSLQNTIDSLAKSGKQVYYVIENPEMHIHPARCFQRPFRLSHESCHIPKAAVLERQRKYRNIISDLSNAKTIDSTMAFCQESHCSFVSSDGTLLHADRDHLSTAGSLVQAQYILSQERNEQSANIKHTYESRNNQVDNLVAQLHSKSSQKAAERPNIRMNTPPFGDIGDVS